MMFIDIRIKIDDEIMSLFYDSLEERTEFYIGVVPHGHYYSIRPQYTLDAKSVIQLLYMDNKHMICLNVINCDFHILDYLNGQEVIQFTVDISSNSRIRFVSKDRKFESVLLINLKQSQSSVDELDKAPLASKLFAEQYLFSQLEKEDYNNESKIKSEVLENIFDALNLDVDEYDTENLKLVEDEKANKIIQNEFQNIRSFKRLLDMFVKNMMKSKKSRDSMNKLNKLESNLSNHISNSVLLFSVGALLITVTFIIIYDFYILKH
ncbi:hypothetical protein RF11_15251 [Thelohanellus kitauei]|uniref:Uncharacterized protein n=1 Tax=Thelohanellus kitauei TaxID=669202 RepID=A0A0C2MR65_THEKT|nr:hypothetical protein RF11_15251 [Thelohanellus kitauei]